MLQSNGPLLPITAILQCTENVNPLSPNGDEVDISHYIIATCLNIQVMRKEILLTSPLGNE